MASRTVIRAPEEIGIKEASRGANKAMMTIAIMANGETMKSMGSPLKLMINQLATPQAPSTARGMAMSKARRP